MRGRLRIELRLTWLGGSRILDRVESQRDRLLRTRPDARRARSAGAALAGRALGTGGGLMAARKTSFYYSFLVLPADQRRAIIAVWDFCRAVDDAVDEEDGSGDVHRARRSPAGAPNWPAASKAGRRRRRQGTRAAAVHP